MFSWIMESRGMQAWSFCNRVLCASGIQLDVEANRLVGASSECRDAFKAILSTSFFCGRGCKMITLLCCGLKDSEGYRLVMLNFHVLQVCCFRAVWDSMFCFQYFCGHVHDNAVKCNETGIIHAIMISNRLLWNHSQHYRTEF